MVEVPMGVVFFCDDEEWRAVSETRSALLEQESLAVGASLGRLRLSGANCPRLAPTAKRGCAASCTRSSLLGGDPGGGELSGHGNR